MFSKIHFVTYRTIYSTFLNDRSLTTEIHRDESVPEFGGVFSLEDKTEKKQGSDHKSVVDERFQQFPSR